MSSENNFIQINDELTTSKDETENMSKSLKSSFMLEKNEIQKKNEKANWWRSAL